MSEPVSEIPTQPKVLKVVIGHFTQNSPEFYFYRQAAVRASVSPDFEVVTPNKNTESLVRMRVPKLMEKRVLGEAKQAMTSPQAKLLSRAYWGQPIGESEIENFFGDSELSGKLAEYSERRKRAISNNGKGGSGIEPFTPSEMENLINEVYNTLPEQKR